MLLFVFKVIFHILSCDSIPAIAGQNISHLLIILNPPLILPVNINHISLKPQRQPYIIGNRGIPHIRIIQTVIPVVHFFRLHIPTEDFFKYCCILFIFSIHMFWKPAIRTGDIEILFSRDLKYRRNLGMKGCAAFIIRMRITQHCIGSMPGICNSHLGRIRQVPRSPGSNKIMLPFPQAMSCCFPYKRRLGMRKCVL